ncbi:MAG: 50S ribosomal protein L20 [Planctomycetota bacterium]|nr:50S ribosomal protein L20 [Planctomycetota bacterium]
MPRARKGAARKQAKNRWFKDAKGNRGARRNHYAKVKEAVIRGGVYATRDRKRVKREYRSLWIIRLNAAAKARGLTYSRLINGLKIANISINRKMLSEMAIHDVKGFDQIVETVKKTLEAAGKAIAAKVASKAAAAV